MARSLLAAATLFLMLYRGAWAQQARPGVPNGQSNGQSSGQAAGLTVGPSNLALGLNAAKLNLPADFAFLAKEQTRQLLEQGGDGAGPGLLGMVVEPGAAESESWEVYLDHIDTGYIKDDEADRLNAEDLLNQMKDATREQNEERKRKGASALQVVGWYKAPTYDRAQHALLWAVIAQDEGSGQRVLNDTVVLLGRRGILVLTAVGRAEQADMLHGKLLRVSASTTFNPGNDYASFRSGDKISDVTMTALVTGGAAAAAYGAVKLGLLGSVGKFLAVGWKFILIGLVACGGLLKKLFSKLTGRSDEAISTTV
jgi:uncharacterized membrane-anchored protein